MIEINRKEDCCGCNACYSICPQKCISMKEDSEGFLYPVVDDDICINCDLCVKVCPCISIRKSEEVTEAYLIQHIDETIRWESSSGGAFTAISDYILELGGLIYGVGYDDEFNVIHKYSSNKEGVKDFRGSKYVQSQINNSFLEIKQFLIQGKIVCFSGTPCQVQGLKSYLNKEYENLYTVDIVCHGVPSPKIWRKYIDYHKNNNESRIKDIQFRNKKYGYSGSTMAIKFENGKEVKQGSELQFMKDLFFADIASRPVCFQCKFKTIERISDFTIFDCWHVNEFDKKLDDDKGTTAILVHSQKGKNIFKNIKLNVRYKSVDVDKIIKLDGDMATQLPKINEKRGIFFAELDKKSVKELMKKYVPITSKRRAALLLKPCFYRLGILKFIKRIKG